MVNDPQSLARTRRRLILGGHLAWLAASTALAVVLLRPPAEILPPRLPPLPNPASKGSAAPPLPTVEALQATWNRMLRQPLFDPPPSAATAVKPAPPPFAAKLVGIVEERGRSQALIALPAGTVELRGVGERLGGVPEGAEVVSIEPRHVVLKLRGESHVLKLETTP